MQDGPAVRRLFWDCSHIASFPHLNTGIERVVRELGAALIELGPEHRLEVVPCLTDGTVQIHRIGIPQVSDPPVAGSEPVTPAPGDIWMLADNAWDPARLIGISPWWRQGMRIVLLQHDLIPVRRPDTTTPLTAALFSQWLFEAVAFADAFVSVSHATREALAGSLKTLAPWRGFTEAELPVVHLASTWRPERPSRPPEPGQPWRFLAVGTVEPRKRYDLLLDVFEEHWRQGGRTELRIVGKKGWSSGALHKRLSLLDEQESRFEWLRDADDRRLRDEYSAASALVSLSSEEGFGLPVIEAAASRLPLVLSDIPVYRETAGADAEFIPSSPAAARTRLLSLLESLDAGRAGLPPAPDRLTARTWKDAAKELLGALDELPAPNQALRQRWDQRAALALAASYERETPAHAASESAAPARVEEPEEAAGGASARRRLAEGYSRLRLRLPQAAVRAMQVRNQLFRLARQLDSRTSVIESRVAALAKVAPTANALQSMRAAEADHVLRYQLDAILADVEKLVSELSGGGAAGELPVDEYRGRLARIRSRLRTSGDG
ncbi:MAG TPA: glycosyltransferase [Acidimicrobiales bacterium]|nr:glycosyltransferase [Acidimicrobiales bacterium]